MVQKRIFNSFLLSFVLIGLLCLGLVFSKSNIGSSYADPPSYQGIVNEVQNYLNVSSNGTTGSVDDTIFLMQGGSTGSTVNVGIANDSAHMITSGEDPSKQNFAYVSSLDASGNAEQYYYFSFPNSLTLYYNLTNSDVQAGQTSNNLLQGQSIDTYATENGDNAFTVSGIGITPQKLEISFLLNTLEDSPVFEDNKVVLNQEGVYTLVIDVNYYYTNNGGISFTPGVDTVYYTFLVFNSNTYFNNTSGLPNLTPSANIQSTALASSNTYSRYYFYNYSYAGDVLTDPSALASLSFNPKLYQLTITYTDLNENTHTSSIVYNSGKFSQVDGNGNVIAEEDYFVQTYLEGDDGKVIFLDLGYYDISLQYLYISEKDGVETTYELPLEQMQNTVLQNKNQRLYVYGYQAVYSDYSTIDPTTNQPQSVELKTFNLDDLIFENGADITGKVNNYLSNDSSIIGDAIAGTSNPKNYIGSSYKTITAPTQFDINLLETMALEYINSGTTPASTNQTPIKFLTNSALSVANSRIYTLSRTITGGVATYSIVPSTPENPNPTNFEGFNHNDPGLYLYIIQYTYDNYLSPTGTLQNSYYHYQIFFFEVTNTMPSVTVINDDLEEIYSNGYTNKGVYIINDAQSNIYDANVTITLSAKNYSTGSYYFQNQDITTLSSYGIHYGYFDPLEDSEENEVYNEKIGGKYGVYIDSNSAYANAFYTISIYSASIDTPSTKTFTIDTNEISGVSARNVAFSSNTTYRIGSTLSSYNTNQPIVFSWDEKDSGATTYGYVKYIPVTAINYYSSQSNPASLTQLLNYWLDEGILPVSYKIDFSLANQSSWSEYRNSYPYSTTIDATYVKSNAGFYILEVYDQAGNSTFEIFLIDNTSPLFVLHVQFNSETREIMTNNQSISVPETGTRMWVEWARQKAIYLENLTDYQNIIPYLYSEDYEADSTRLSEKLDGFFNWANNDDIYRATRITVGTVSSSSESGQIATGVSSYNGSYLLVDIDEVSYMRDTTSSSYTRQQGVYSYEINFINEKNEAIEGTYRFLIRDHSNTFITGNEQYDFLNNPSAFLTFNVTSDDSKLSVLRGEGESQEQLIFSSFNNTGNLYYYEEGGERIYTHLPYIDQTDLEQSELTYRFAYYSPVNADQNLIISFIPLAENGSRLDYVTLKYYPYVKTQYALNGTYYYYYDVSDEYQEIPVYKNSNNVNYEAGEVITFDLALGTGALPLAGRYVIERQYVEGNDTDQYDYFRRTITFDVDDFGLISKLETVNNGEDSSLESIVGGDIVLSMYSGEGNSSIEVSFPSYNEDTGLNNGSFYTREEFDSEDIIPTFSVSGNKLPMSLYVPKYKFTTYSVYDEATNSYSVSYNNGLSYYGNTYYSLGSDNLWHVYSEGVEIVDAFNTEAEAVAYIQRNASITEYELQVKVEANVVENGRSVTKYYYSNGSTANGYLQLYETASNGIIGQDAQPVDYFYLQGSYVVTLYQSYNDPQNSFYSFYKFGFEIISQEPEFNLLDADGYQLEEVSSNVYYTNTDQLTVQWEVPTSSYEAKINEDFDYINITSSGVFSHSGEIVANGNVRSFTIDCSQLINVTGSQLRITMEFEGHNSNYYRQTTKTIYFDRSAPLNNVTNLMANTETATGVFTTNYQQLNMRTYQDYKGNDLEISASNIGDISNASYSYSVSTGNFRYYSYTVTTDFFNKTLVGTLTNASRDSYGTQYIYYRAVPALDSYTQVDRNSFSENNYYVLSTEISEDIVCGYYEIVERDYAGNMTVYLVYVTDSSYEDDENISDIALVYTNSNHSENNYVYNSDITNGYNIYSNSGFTLSQVSYNSDPWNVLYVQIYGQSQVRYMTSPWLEDGYIYRVSISSQGISFEQVALSSIFAGVDSSSYKHQITLTNRTTGTSNLIYLSIMDANIYTEKVEDPERNSAILNISVPTPSQYQSATTAYVFPVNIKIYQYSEISTAPDGYDILMEANQLVYGSWTPLEEYESALSYISFNYINNASTLQIVINLGANASQKVKFVLLDNFDNLTTIIQLANEVAYDEISGISTIYTMTESNGDTTYLSDGALSFSYNTLLYSIEILDRDGVDITNGFTAVDKGNNIFTYNFTPTGANIWDDYYRINIYDSENGDYIKTLHLRLYNQLPYLAYQTSEVYNGGIVFLDRNLKPFERSDYGEEPNTTVSFNGNRYSATATSLTTYSPTVRVRFRDGQSLNYSGLNSYQDGYGYSVYLSTNNGSSWTSINDKYSATSGYSLSGVGEYLILIIYDSTEVFTNMCRIFRVSILDYTTSFYYITVDGLPIEPSDMVYTDSAGHEYHTSYLVSVDYADKANRLQVNPNVERDVILSGPSVTSTGTNVYVETYSYECSQSRGDFAIIYIAETNNIVSEFTYESTSGGVTNIRSSSTEVVVDGEDERQFDRIKINFTSYYGIAQNKVNAEVLKYFNGQYTQITPAVYTNGITSYIYLDKAGSYRIRLYDSCSPANVQTFNGNEYFDLIFLNGVPFIVSYTDTVTGEQVVSEMVNNAVYNGDVKLSLYNLSTYYRPGRYPSISVRRNGYNYTDYSFSNNVYTFSSPGYYTITFSATSLTGAKEIRQDQFSFTIMNENESRYSYTFSQYKDYYVESVLKDGIDITQDLIDIGNFDTVQIDGKTYLSELSLSYLDEKTGRGKYQITINTADPTFADTTSSSYTFELWLNNQVPPLNISLAEGDSTTGTITINFNVQNFYNAMGDCYIRIGQSYYYFTADRLANYNDTFSINIEDTGTYYVQVYTMSGNLLYSYKVIRSEPLNTFAIIAIIFGCVAVVAIIVITIRLRKRQRVK